MKVVRRFLRQGPLSDEMRRQGRALQSAFQLWPGRVIQLPGPYFIKSGYRHRSDTSYHLESTRGGVVYQPDVYRRTAEIARKVGAHRVVDIGCGDGEKLVALYPEFEVVGIDYGENLEQCRKQYDVGTWLEHDIESDDPLPVMDLERAVIICADVIEHLVRPEKLLAKLRLALATCSAVVMSTPERNLTRGVHHTGPPPNPAHVREWTINEFSALLAAEGFHGRVGLTRSKNNSPLRNTILAELFPR